MTGQEWVMSDERTEDGKQQKMRRLEDKRGEDRKRRTESQKKTVMSEEKAEVGGGNVGLFNGRLVKYREKS